MHPMLLNAYNAALPRLWAEEQLAALAVTTAGAGLMDQAEHRQLVTSLRRAAQGAGHREPEERPASLDDLRESLGSMGIAVIVNADG